MKKKNHAIKVLAGFVVGFCGAFSALATSSEAHVEVVVARILENVAKIRAADTNAVPMAFWDFDGTIIPGDLASGLLDENTQLFPGLFGEIIRAGFIPAYPSEDGFALWRKDLRRMREFGYWLSQEFDAQVFAGIETKVLDAFCQRTIRERGLDRWFFASSVAIWKALAAAGVENYIVSASTEPMMRNIAPFLGIPISHVRATRVQEEGGRWTTKLVLPIPYGEGKVDAVRALVLARPHGVPVAGFGNNYPTDAAFLRYVATQPNLPGGAKATSVMINGGAKVAGYSEHFVLVEHHATVGGQDVR